MVQTQEERQAVYLPEMQKRRSRRRRRFGRAAAFLFIYLLILGCLWLILWTPAFRLKNLAIAGAEGIASEELTAFLRLQVMDARWKHVLGFDSMLVWPESFSPDYLIYLPALKSVKIHRDYRERSILLEIEERIPFGIWCLSGREVPECFWFDDEGVILARAPLAEGNLIPAVGDYSRGNLGVGAKVLPEGGILNLLSVFRVLAAARVGVAEVRLENIALSELKVLTYDGPELYFSLRFPADGAFAVLESLRSASSTAVLHDLDYIDFRSENRAYYK